MKKSTLYYWLTSLVLAMLIHLPEINGQTFSASHEGINSNNEVCVDITVADFENIIGMQFSMHYDDNLLSFSGFSNLSALNLSTANFGNISNQGAITFSWIDPTVSGVTLPDNEIIFSLCFLPITAGNVTTPISFENTPTAIEILDVNDQILNAVFNSGSITISSMGGPLELASAVLVAEICGDSNGSISLITVGGMPPYSYNWQGPDGFSSTEENIGGLSAGTYDLTIEDSEGATLSASYSLGNESLLITSANVNPVGCNGSEGSINLATNGVSPSFQWSNGATSEDVQVSEAGNYTVTITEGNCSVTETYQVEAEDGLASYAYDCTYINPGLIEAQLHVLLWCGGTPPYTFSWSDGTVETTNLNESTLLITNPSGILYSVTITDEQGFEFILSDMEAGCSFPPGITGSITHVNCTNQTDGSIDITVSGGSQNFSFLWSNGATSEDVTGLISGYYTVVVTDNETGLSATKEFFVAGSLNLAYTYQCQFPISTTLSVISWTGLGPITFEWSNGFTETVNNPSLVNFSSITFPMEAGPVSYTITATDATGCSETLVAEVDCENPENDLYLSISPEQTNIQQGESTCIEVVAGNFNDIISMQFTVNWDPSLLHFEEVTNFNLPGLSATNFGMPQNDQLTFSWLDPPLEGVTLANNTPVFSLCFTALNANGTATIEITDTPTDIEVINSMDEEQTVQTTGGIITIGNPPAGQGAVYITTNTAIPGDITCVEVRALDLYNVGGMQFSMNWNPEALIFNGVENFLFEPETSIALTFSSLTDAAESGELRFVYFSNDFASGLSISEDTPLFELCFEVVAENGIEPVTISNSPIPIEFIGINAIPINVSTSGGEIIILDPLWPGDTDLNGIVDQYDLLNIGLSYGAAGTARILSTDWTPFYVQDWGQTTPLSGIDYKHMDTDGTGAINTQDTLAISLNWGSTNENWDNDPGIAPQGPTPGTTLTIDAPFYVESDTVTLDQTTLLNIILGDENFPATGIYGIGFTITFDPEVVVPGSVHARFENSWLGSIGENLIGIYREDYEAGKLNVAVTRIDGLEVSGNGPIGAMQITIKDVIFREGLTEVPFGIEGVRIINWTEQEILVQPIPTISFIDTTTDLNDPELAEKVSIFPTPASQRIFISAKNLEITALELYNSNGELVKKSNNDDSLSVKEFTPGTYFLRIISKEGVIIKRISKI